MYGPCHVGPLQAATVARALGCTVRPPRSLRRWRRTIRLLLIFGRGADHGCVMCCPPMGLQAPACRSYVYASVPNLGITYYILGEPLKAASVQFRPKRPSLKVCPEMALGSMSRCEFLPAVLLNPISRVIAGPQVGQLLLWLVARRV